MAAWTADVNGRTSSWFRGAQSRRQARIQAGGVQRDVLLVETDNINDELDAAYRTKYGRYATSLIDPRRAREREPRRSSWFPLARPARLTGRQRKERIA
jgi:hypothetical protein